MTAGPGARRRARAARDRGRRPDAGLTLVEAVVAMAVFAIVLAVAMSATVSMTRETVRTEVLGTAQDTARVAFQRLDHQVRYAEALNLPGPGTGGAVYVELRVSAAASVTGQAQCSQWRYDPAAGTLARRTWTDTTNPVVPGWHVVATKVLRPAGASATYPFTVRLASGALVHQVLDVALTVGDPRVGVEVATASSFVARNSSPTSLSNTDANGDGSSDLAVCLSAVGRP
ncbi:prepilin-type N-terminal cleavage/methylation domain-containing protein [Cellulomonas marina]|uniref:Type IV pilin N-term methylation site GFxxxE n=1 Tax=Cellulomonas marina TaxID=988821 RepID=A0A1I0W9I6_9CELL|nr:prepilin-type N-terminal cleavage/methylation domain-containing protein [Cellulomonas marina]GIG29131.1 hypothetical protein Cma02nite_17310 [Cellulomonas marina]SFA84576.1 Type IV pilin N-term methylation site GFxxxE [Cellulomonas marina]